MRSCGWIIAGHRAKEGGLVAPLLSALHFVSVSMPIAVAFIVPVRLFEIIIDVGAFQHFGEIDGDPIKDDPRLSISVDMFVSGARDRGGVID